MDWWCSFRSAVRAIQSHLHRWTVPWDMDNVVRDTQIGWRFRDMTTLSLVA